MSSEKNRKQEILNAALVEFSEHGFGGARLQSVANRTGMTKAMVHYYFETKENLFKEVFREACGSVMAGLLDILETEEPLFAKIEHFVEVAIDRFDTNPALVDFITGALNRKPGVTASLLWDQLDYDASVFDRQLKEAASNYEIAVVDSRQILLNMLSLCMFPYVGRTFMRELLQTEAEAGYQELLNQRKGIVADTIINWLAS